MCLGIGCNPCGESFVGILPNEDVEKFFRFVMEGEFSVRLCVRMACKGTDDESYKTKSVSMASSCSDIKTLSYPLDIEKYIFAHTNHNSDKRSIHIISTNFTPCFEVEWLLL